MTEELAQLPFDELVRRVRACTLCQDVLPLGPRPVVQLSESARILVVGQAPGRRVHETGLPFNDPSGDRLRDWMGVTRDTFYDEQKLAILPMGFCYPGTGKSGDLPPRPECAETWRQALLDRLPNIELTLLIGQYAQNWHLPEGRNTVTDTVRHWQTYWPRMMPTPHPSPRNNLWLRRNPWFEAEAVPALRERVSMVLSNSA
ncbi:uracil-DNA glycosylase family protein [Marinobacter sp. F4216]|uniref:uracil-DNA glycosylase family protein n=1 Tax=Marinobacter sp. F4216 TaxID=2874281 RepID=UPI001CBF0F09|nr:uracil-DNA glycosylase family protein [Marinobacter sp. F4216]MBZ2167712.1 uracil-DNA glycosylase family protein [Marinobacter sp. F4216]